MGPRPPPPDHWPARLCADTLNVALDYAEAQIAALRAGEAQLPVGRATLSLSRPGGALPSPLSIAINVKLGAICQGVPPAPTVGWLSRHTLERRIHPCAPQTRTLCQSPVQLPTQQLSARAHTRPHRPPPPHICMHGCVH